MSEVMVDSRFYVFLLRQIFEIFKIFLVLKSSFRNRSRVFFLNFKFSGIY